MTRRRRSYRSPFGAMAGILSGLAGIMDAPRKFRKRMETYTLEQVRIERERLKLQQDQARIARENNAVLLQDLEIEIKKLELEKLRREESGYATLHPDNWNG